MKRRGWKQRPFARKIHVDSGAISRFCSGKNVPRMRRGAVMADALGLTGAERQRFLLALALANSPPVVRQLVARLRRESRGRHQ